MSPSPQNIPITTSDELHIHPVKSLLHSNSCAELVARPQPSSPPPSSLPLVSPPTPVPSSCHNAASNTTSMSTSTLQSIVQPNPSSTQNSSTTSTPINGNLSCLTPASALGQLAKTSSQPLDPNSVNSACLSPQTRQPINPSFSFPGASSSATAYERIFPNSSDSLCTLTEASSTESISSTSSQRTPNVYINGLPPHFSEQDLFALARPFGDIKSVRTFTRHVSEKPTGYGFVLFGDVESAQRCIDGLRKHRNLHPSFSKQVHRIPGTEYAQHIVMQSTNLDENSFKFRMEKLQDNTSTNLYIEGLPLSTDEESLAALVQPYKIKSSRLFKTKLSTPPRIIAFVRLETRGAAEETIERLHGRMVRGWNDPGCRISVRFADSTEQRELRRAERMLKTGDQSPSRLTIAEAALLNLRGQDLQTNIRDAEVVKSRHPATLRSDAALHTIPDLGLLPISHSLPSNLRYARKEAPLSSISDLSISEMDKLLQSLQNMDYEDKRLDDGILNNEYLALQQAQLQTLSGANLLSPNSLTAAALSRGHTQARNGFTPAEELILEAHAQRFQLQAQLSRSRSSLRKINENVQSLDSVFLDSPRLSGVAGKAMFSGDTLPTISEDAIHAMGPPHSLIQARHNPQGLVDSPAAAVRPTTSAGYGRPPSRAVSIVPPPPDYEEPGKRGKSHHQRVRSRQIPCHSASFNARQIIPSAEFKPHSSSLQTSTRSNNSRNDDHNNPSKISSDKNIEFKNMSYSHDNVRSYSEEDKGARFRSSSASQVYYIKKSPQLGEQNSTVKPGPKSPAVASPALTYSSRTPSTLSPATPFFGSFTGSVDTFDVVTMENEDAAERRLKARTIANK